MADDGRVILTPEFDLSELDKGAESAKNKLLLLYREVEQLGKVEKQRFVQQLGVIEQLQLREARLAELRNKANNVSQIEKLNRALGETQKKMRDLESSTSTAGKQTGVFTQLTGKAEQSLSALGKTFAAYFAVSQIKDYLSAAQDAWLEQEKVLIRLNTQIVTIGQSSKGTAQSLIAQADALQAQGLVSDDVVENVQVMLSQFGLLPSEIKKAIPIILDFAAATGQNLDEAAQVFVQGLSGMGRGLKKFGLDVDANKNVTENLNSLIEQMGEKFKGSAAAIQQSSGGIQSSIKIVAEEFKEQVGKVITPAWTEFLATMTLLFKGDFAGALSPSATKKLFEGMQAAASQAKQTATDIASINKEIGKLEETNIKLESQLAGATLIEEAQIRTRMEINKQLIQSLLEQADQSVIRPETDAQRKAKEEAARKALADAKRLAEQIKANLKSIEDAFNKAPILETLQQFEKGTEDFSDAVFNRLLAANAEAFASGAIKAEEYEHRLEELTRQAEDSKLRIVRSRLIIQLKDYEEAGLQEVQLYEDVKNKLAEIDKEIAKNAAEAFKNQTEEIKKNIKSLEDAVSKQGFLGSKASDAPGNLLKQYTETYSKIVDIAINAYQQILNAEIALNNEQIRIQTTRVEQALLLAERGNAEYLQKEQERLDALQRKQEAFAKQQAVLAQLTAVANVIAAVAAAAAQSGILSPIAIAEVIAALATGIAAGVALIKGFEGGGYTGDGRKDEPAGVVHRGEYVMDKHDTAQNREAFEEVHQRKLNLRAVMDKARIYDQIQARINVGEISKMVVVHNKNEVDMAAVNEKLDEVIQAIRSKKETSVMITKEGIGVIATEYISDTKKLNRLAS